jgi:hypothetical protein
MNETLSNGLMGTEESLFTIMTYKYPNLITYSEIEGNGLMGKFFEDLKTLSYCGFKKMHPHDTDSIIRVAFKESTEKATVKQNLKSCLNDAIAVYKNIMKKF